MLEEFVLGFDISLSSEEWATSYVRPGVYRGCDPVCWEHPPGYGSHFEVGGVRRDNRFLFFSLPDAISIASELPNHDVTCVGIILVGENLDSSSLSNLDCLYPGSTDTDRISPHWRLLGYDVADQFLASVLCSNGAVADLLSDPSLNDVGLFREYGIAREVASVADEHSPSHAPFLVLGIYAV